MADKSGIEWTEATWPVETLVVFTEANGRVRRRVYVRKHTDRPGAAERRARLAEGYRWCRGCRDWLGADLVRSGVCRPCANAEYRVSYAKDGAGIREQKKARKRGVRPLPTYAAELLTEQFEGRCAYCPAFATTWDHIEPVNAGGDTVPGNVVPACASCNPSKKACPLAEWLLRTGRDPQPALWDVLALDVAEVS